MNLHKNMLSPVFSKYAVLDGGLSVELVNQGHKSVNADPLWGGRLLTENPSVIKDTHKSFLKAGSDVIETLTYQASVSGYMNELKVSEEKALSLIRYACIVAKEARDEFWQESEDKGRQRPLVAGSIGPYGACLCDGSEYTGSYVDQLTIEDLISWHKPRMKTVIESGVDLVAIETIPAVKEAVAMVKLLAEFPDTKAWITFACRDGESLFHGEKLSDAVAKVIDCPQVVAVGINCTAPQHVESLLKSLKDFKTQKALVVYPNTGEDWTKELSWHGKEKHKPLFEYVPQWMAEGATWIGGCCRVDPKDISNIKIAMESVKEKLDKK